MAAEMVSGEAIGSLGLNGALTPASTRKRAVLVGCSRWVDFVINGREGFIL